MILLHIYITTTSWYYYYIFIISYKYFNFLSYLTTKSSNLKERGYERRKRNFFMYFK